MVRVVQLESGMKVMVCADPGRTALAVNLRVPGGIRHEQAGEAGISHLVEHLLIDRAPPGIIGDVERKGGHVFGGVNRDYTTYWLGGPVGFRPRPWKDLADIVFSTSTFLPADCERELPVVADELDGIARDEDALLQDMVYGAAFGCSVLAGQSLAELSGAELAGRAGTFHSRTYLQSSSLLVVCGPVRDTDILPDASPPNRPPGRLPATGVRSDGPLVIAAGNGDDGNAAGLLLTASGAVSGAAAGVLSTLLCDGMRSLLFRQFRSESLGYDCRSEVIRHGDATALFLRFSCSPSVLVRTVGLVTRVLAGLVRSVESDDIELAHGRLRGETLLAWDDVFSRTSLLARRAWYGESVDSIEGIVGELDRVGKSDLMAAAGAFTDPRRAVLAVTGFECDPAALRAELENLA